MNPEPAGVGPGSRGCRMFGPAFGTAVREVQELPVRMRGEYWRGRGLRVRCGA